ncbi:hypothetical protein [Amycolatopsis sp. FDAARGOS 1241]|uniref:hypothetical protein n=1 Tax=Amycolatopsis sp. FDAARGOS 1241 TaxID=2778070 RepID=UPI0019511F6A|nr:hypothetical protein [Amycolatopsis sp. FDAARGOS 1241]QRP49147.1 hypothetical protein I6J71_16000 [Amycolatopsis sp. FDAARGOS 1241]
MTTNQPGGQEPLDAEIVENPAAPLAPGGAPEVPEPDYSERGVPSFDYVRDRIENRYNTSVGAQELAGIGGPETLESLDKKIEERDQKAKDKLAEIRRAMRKE